MYLCEELQDWIRGLEVLHWQRLSVGYGSNDKKMSIGEGVEWMVCHFDRKYLHHRLVIINFLSLSDEDSYHLHQKSLDETFQ